MKNLIKIMVVGLFAVGFLYAENMGKEEKGYRIEVIIDTIQKEPYVKAKRKEVRFISPEGNVIRRISLSSSVKKEGEYWYSEGRDVEDTLSDKGLVLITEYKIKTSYDPRKLEEYYVEKGEYWDMEAEVIDAKGKTKFRKMFRTYPGDDPTAYYWRGIFSKEGNAVLFFYRDEEGKFNIEVYDMNGKMLASAKYDEYLHNLQISPDGKIIGAETIKKVNGKWYRHLFFLDVETGRTKMVKAEGRFGETNWWRAGADLDHYSLKSGEIRIGVFLLDKPSGITKTLKSVHVNLTFEELPDDLSILFKQGGGK